MRKISLPWLLENASPNQWVKQHGPTDKCQVWGGHSHEPSVRVLAAFIALGSLDAVKAATGIGYPDLNRLLTEGLTRAAKASCQ